MVLEELVAGNFFFFFFLSETSLATSLFEFFFNKGEMTQLKGNKRQVLRGILLARGLRPLDSMCVLK